MYAAQGALLSLAAFRKACWKERDLTGKRVKSETKDSAVSHLRNDRGEHHTEWFAVDTSSPWKQLWVRTRLCDRPRVSRRLAWAAMIRFPSDCRSLVVRVLCPFWTRQSSTCCLAGRVGKPERKSTSRVLMNTFSKALTSGRARWAGKRRSVMIYWGISSLSS